MPMTTRLNRFIQRARELVGEQMTALMGLIWEVEGLRESFQRQDGKKAPGVDGMRKDDYREGSCGEERTGHGRRGAAISRRRTDASVR